MMILTSARRLLENEDDRHGIVFAISAAPLRRAEALRQWFGR